MVSFKYLLHYNQHDTADCNQSGDHNHNDNDGAAGGGLLGYRVIISGIGMMLLYKISLHIVRNSLLQEGDQATCGQRIVPDLPMDEKVPSAFAEGTKYCEDGLLLQGLLNCNSHGNGHTDHGVVAWEVL